MRTLGNRSIAAFLKRVLDVVYFLAFVPPVLVVGFAIVLAFIDSDHLTTHPVASLEFRPEAREIHVPGEGMRRFEIQDAWAFIEVEGVPKGRFYVGLGCAMLQALVVLYLLRELRAIFATLRAADPFVPENASHIRNVGLSILALELTAHAYHFASWFLYVSGRVALEGVRTAPRFDPSLLALSGGVALLLVAEAFRLGARMREEQQLTV